MRTMKSSLPAVLALAVFAHGHTIFQRVYVNGVDQGHLSGIRVPDSNWPVMDISSTNVICNGGVNPYHQPLPTTVIQVSVGSTLTAEWHPSLEDANTTEPIRPDHKGPITAYLAQILDPLQNSVTNLSWFKIYQSGFDPQTRTWATDMLIANQGKVDFAIPSCVPAGAYLLRHEIIAVHKAETYPGAQFYVECAYLNITNGGSTLPSELYLTTFPGAYQAPDPGITVNIENLTSYTVPGPPVFTCQGSSDYLL